MKKQPVNTEHDLRLLELRRELRDTARELHFAYDRFNYVTDPGLIEAGIYDINALKSRYDFLLRKMKLAQGQAVPSRCPEPPCREEPQDAGAEDPSRFQSRSSAGISSRNGLAGLYWDCPHMERNSERVR